MRDAPLEVRILDGLLTISIGIDTLAAAVCVGPLFEQAEVVDVDTFAADLLDELRREEEDGTTPVHRLFDQVASDAFENGSLGFQGGEEDG